MSSPIISCFLAIPMLLHGLFGCCWHHVGCLRGAEHVAESHSTSPHGLCGCLHSQLDHDGCESESDEFTHESDSEIEEVALADSSLPEPPHTCTGSRCDYLTSDRVRTADPGLVASPSNPCDWQLSGAIRTSAGLAVSPLALPAADDGTGQLRAHVLCCVWLI